MGERYGYDLLIGFAAAILRDVGCDGPTAGLMAEVLVEADARGIPSHGIARLKRYVDHIREGVIEPGKQPVTVSETPVSAVLDGNNGAGQTVADRAMKLATAKAAASGVGLVTVRNSNHFGIAGYYAEQALAHGQLGIALTNTAPLVVPTHGCRALLGTNPLAVAFPLGGGRGWLLDMATSVIPRGKLESCQRQGKKIPPGWATGEDGRSADDPGHVLRLFDGGKAGGILPLGGEGEEFGGHKGFGLAMLVELLTAGLSQGACSPETYRGRGGICHFFAALRLDLFGDPSALEAHVKRYLEEVVASPRAEGQARIWLHGEKEAEARRRSLETGIVLDRKTIEGLRALGEACGHPFA